MKNWIKKGSVMLFVLAVILTACDNTQQSYDTEVEQSIVEPTNKVVLASEINWEQLNPARGDQSPKAGTIWGDRNGSVPTGFLVSFVDGFSSPPHIHNVTYRGMVISGLVHNDDPNAEEMWMPAGSFWTQPAGESHITSAKGETTIAYIEIDNGPYLVMPPQEAFDNGERPVNVHKSNIVWVDDPNTDNAAATAQLAFLWGSHAEGELNGNLIKLPPGFKGEIKSYGSIFHSVVIEGEIEYQVTNDHSKGILNPGSYFTSEGLSSHIIQSGNSDECIIYIRTDGSFEVISDHSEE